VAERAGLAPDSTDPGAPGTARNRVDGRP
jgi:hypothetical protein